MTTPRPLPISPCPGIDIVIINWNSGDQLRACIDSLYSIDFQNTPIHKVIIVDNGSTDGSTQGLECFRSNLVVVPNKENTGFAAACNQGARLCSCPYILFLNPDTLVQGNALHSPLNFMESSEGKGYGICSVQTVDEFGHVTRTSARFPKWRHFVSYGLGVDRLFPQIFPSHFMHDWDHLESQAVDHVIGAFFLVRKSVFEQLGGFDERFFVYLEDLDFSYRAAKAGWRSYFLASACIFHHGGGTSHQIKARRLFFSLRSRLLYGFKHFSLPGGAGSAVVCLLIEPFVRSFHALLRGSASTIIETLQAYGMLYRSLPDTLRQAFR
jgi:GT2 family glycosyltransferase